MVTFSIRNVALLIVAFQIGQLARQNPMLFGQKVDTKTLPNNTTFPIYTNHIVLDRVLSLHQEEIGETDFPAYRNHCLRVLSLAGYFFRDEEGYQKLDRASSGFLHVLDVMALALGYHDIGLWTDKKLDYLEPSVALMDREFPIYFASPPDGDNTNELSLSVVFTKNDLATARAMIREHHKFTPWEKISQQLDADHEHVEIDRAAVNAVRRADWADATMGIVKSGLSPAYLEQLYNILPDNGFHRMLLDFGGRLSPNSLFGRMELMKIFKW